MKVTRNISPSAATVVMAAVAVAACVPLTNETWVYSPDDDTLFRLISLGSDGLKQAGYSRVHSEVVVGPMPPFGGIIKTSDDLWKVISFIRSVNPNSIKNEGATYQPKNY
jgi:hypothetical protein